MAVSLARHKQLAHEAMKILVTVRIVLVALAQAISAHHLIFLGTTEFEAEVVQLEAVALGALAQNFLRAYRPEIAPRLLQPLCCCRYHVEVRLRLQHLVQVLVARVVAVASLVPSRTNILLQP